MTRSRPDPAGAPRGLVSRLGGYALLGLILAWSGGGDRVGAQMPPDATVKLLQELTNANAALRWLDRR